VETKLAGEYLTFRVASQDFAILAARVRGLVPAHELSLLEIPLSEQCGSILGIVILRGRDVPVVDLRGKLGIERGSQGRQPCVVVVEACTGRLAGFVAECVSEVRMLRDRDFRNGSVRINGRVRRVLDADEILTEAEFLSCWNLADGVTASPSES